LNAEVDDVTRCYTSVDEGIMVVPTHEGSRSGEFTRVNTGITLNYDNNSVVAKYH
jgi:hypothetical protein